MAVPGRLVAPLKETFCPPLNVRFNPTWFPLILPESTPDEKHQFTREIPPPITGPVWDRLAVRVPLAPKAALHVPCQAPVRLITPTDDVTLKYTVFELPPPGDGLITTTGWLPATVRSDGLNRMESTPLLKKDGAWGSPLNTTVEDGMKPLPLIVSVRELLPTAALDGDRLVIEGFGFDAGGNG
jgi:hypothetical protein